MQNTEQELFVDLNYQQQQAVMAGVGPILVLAGPGSGKTKVLTHRIAYVLSRLKVRPQRVLAVTFTNKAAKEMEQRIQLMLNKEARGLVLGTFHSVCARFLRSEASFLPVNDNFVIYDADDQIKLVERVLEDLNLDKKKNTPRSMHAAISYAKNELRTPDDLQAADFRTELIKRVYHRYQELLLANNAMDFDDLLMYMARLLEENPQIRQQYANRFEHVLVDEFQDTNMAQYMLIKHIASFHRNIFVVGDVDQSIYRWRGADYRNVLRFRNDYPDAQTILLEQNYRSTQYILDVATSVINQNPNRTQKKLFTELGNGHKPTLKEVYDDYAEAAYVVETITKLIQKKEAQPGDIAVMYRTNAQSRVLEEAFLRANIPYKIVGAQRFYGRREVKDVLAYLRLINNIKDEVSFIRIINVPSRKIGTKTIEQLHAQAQKLHLSLGEYLINSLPLEDRLWSASAFRSLMSFRDLLMDWKSLAAEVPPRLIMERVLDDVQYRGYIDDGTDEGYGRWENVLELKRLAAENEGLNLSLFLEQVALVSDQDTLESTNQLPTLLTLHAAKGLEFGVVFIIGLNDGILPHVRSFDDEEQMMEERRLFYVGITRAKKRLFLVYSQTNNAQGYASLGEPSRFLGKIPPSYFEKDELLHEVRSMKSLSTNETDWGKRITNIIKRTSIQEAQYKTGNHVKHPLWGEGLILSSKIEDNEEILDIFFENIGLKRVIASLAKLQVIKKD